PCTPTADRLSFTSSSLNGLMIASTFFMGTPPATVPQTRDLGLCECPRACKDGAPLGYTTYARSPCCDRSRPETSSSSSTRSPPLTAPAMARQPSEPTIASAYDTATAAIW